MQWAYGVTTVPERINDLLPQTLKSLDRAGFGSPDLFVDGATNTEGEQIAKRFGLRTVCRYPKIRVHGNWILALMELFIREPCAERYAVFQDDFITCKNLRSYLEKCRFPKCGYWNLYTYPSNQQICPKDSMGRDAIGWYEARTLNSGTTMQSGRGALGLVFDGEGVVTLLSAKTMVERPMDLSLGWRKIDGGVVNSMNIAGYREYVHNPSLLQHTGIVSSFDKRHRTGQGKSEGYPPYHWPKEHLATSFPGEDFDLLTLLG